MGREIDEKTAGFVLIITKKLRIIYAEIYENHLQ